MRMRASTERQQHGRIKSDGRKSKTCIRSAYVFPFFLCLEPCWCFESRTFLQNIFSMTKIGCFLRGFFTCRFFSSIGFLGPLKNLKTQRQKVMLLSKSDFHWQSNAFLWFDLQTRGFTYQGGKLCIVAMFSCFKTKSEKKIYHARFIYQLDVSC